VTPRLSATTSERTGPGCHCGWGCVSSLLTRGLRLPACWLRYGRPITRVATPASGPSMRSRASGHVRLGAARHRGGGRGVPPRRSADGRARHARSRPIYPGWYSSRAVHIHVQAHLGERTATTQLYFPEAITDDVFAVAPYAGRPQRDTTNETDSIFIEEGGKDAVLTWRGALPMAIRACCASPSPPTRGDVASEARIRATIEAHVAAVGAPDAAAVADLSRR
jgi:hypothetical protein